MYIQTHLSVVNVVIGDSVIISFNIYVYPISSHALIKPLFQLT